MLAPRIVRLLIAALLVVLIDTVAIAFGGGTLLGLPKGPVIAIFSAAFILVIAVVSDLLAKPLSRMTSTGPIGEVERGGVKVRASLDARAWISVIEMLAAQITLQEDVRQTLVALAWYLKESAKQDRASQIRLAAITTLIGLLGGWLPYLIIAIQGGH